MLCCVSLIFLSLRSLDLSLSVYTVFLFSLSRPNPTYARRGFRGGLPGDAVGETGGCGDVDALARSPSSVAAAAPPRRHRPRRPWRGDEGEPGLLDIVSGGPELAALSTCVLSCRIALHDAASVRAKSIVAYSVRERVGSPTRESPEGGAKLSSAYTISLSYRVGAADVDGATAALGCGSSAMEVTADDATEETEMDEGKPGFGVGLDLAQAVPIVLRSPLDEAASLALLSSESRRDLVEFKEKRKRKKETRVLVDDVRLG